MISTRVRMPSTQAPPAVRRRIDWVLWITCVALLAWAHPARSEMVNRWSFNDATGPAPSGTPLVDSISGGVAVVRGIDANFTGSSLTLPGTTTGDQPESTIAAYVDLPNGIISSHTNLTVEIWASYLSTKNWHRLFDFGRTVQAGDGAGAPGEWTGISAPGATEASDGIMLALQHDRRESNKQRLEATLNGVATTLDTTLASTTGVQYHYVVTYESGVGGFPTGGRFTWYRDGTVAGSIDVSYPLSEIEDVNNWLGRSQDSALSNSHISYNEVRIYDNALTPAEVAASYQSGPEQGLRYRWSFNGASGNVANGTVFPDSISDAPATVRGVGATADGAALSLPGSTTGNQTPATVSAYVDLPNGMISSLENLTLELWATPLSSKTWQRLFDFGNSNVGDGLGETGEWTGGATAAPGFTQASDEFALTLSVADLLNIHRLYGRLNYDQVGGLNLLVESPLATTPGQGYHYVITFESGVGTYASTGGRQSWYRDGDLIASQDLPYPLADINDVNNWLGRSQFSGDSVANVAFDEVRIYSYAFTPDDVVASRDEGPDSLGTPATMADSVTMHPGQKARIAVLENDTGPLNSQTVSIATSPSAGTAVADGSGTILYTNTNPMALEDSFTYTVQGPGGISEPADVTVTFTNDLRITNPALAMPAEPPATVFQVVDALPGVTFNQPICISTVPGDSHRLFVCERLARIQVVPDVIATQPTKQLFLDLQQVVAGRTPVETIEDWALGENGVLGLAFHPDYATNGYFYVAYTVRINNGSYYQRISRFTVDGSDPNKGDPSSELILLQQLDEGFNHNGGDLHFGPDGYLYYAAGDEENPNDFRQNSQRINKDFFAGVFRIDVDLEAEDYTPADGTGGDDANLPPNSHPAIISHGGHPAFEVPVDNPYVAIADGGTWDGTYNGSPVTGTVRTEFWATGLRHTWRMSFDPVTGDLWGGDVGQDTWEEVNKIVKGGNYGWVYREGAHDFSAAPPGFTSMDPVHEYLHGNGSLQGNSVCGGYVYRGSRFPSLEGYYIFCDSVSGHVWQMDTSTGATTRISGLPGEYGVFSSMGVDPSNGDILFAAYNKGTIMRLATGDVSDAFPSTLSDTGLFADLTDLSPNPGLLPYDPNLPFWSDYAIKSRWFTIPNSGMMTWARDANWTFPTGMLWVKHFDLELTRGDPSTKRRIETRVLVKTDSGTYGVSYRWNEAQTEATLVPEEGVEFNLDIIENGVAKVQRWGIPGRTSCLTCHTPQAGGSLSFSTRQLNRYTSINGFAGNQLQLLHSGGYFSNTPDSPNVLPRHLRPDEVGYPVEARVRSYIAVNCAYCHRADGTVSGANWDGRPELTLADTQLINGAVVNNGGNPDNKLVVPGDIVHSVVLNRIAVANGFSRMPPLASNELDQTSIDLVTDWIANYLPTRQTYDEWRLANFGSSSSPQGEPDFDADGDRVRNDSEFVSGTNPLDSSSFLTAEFSTDGTSATVTFNVPENRSAFVETCTDLKSGNWVRWDAPGNDGIPRHAGPVSITGSVSSPQQFFRLRFEEI